LEKVQSINDCLDLLLEVAAQEHFETINGPYDADREYQLRARIIGLKWAKEKVNVHPEIRKQWEQVI
jgi:hypothetical protein